MIDRILPAHRADRGELVDALGQRHERGQRLERLTRERDVQSRDDDHHPSRGEVADHLDELRAEELGLVDGEHVGRVVADGCRDLRG